MSQLTHSYYGLWTVLVTTNDSASLTRDNNNVGSRTKNSWGIPRQGNGWDSALPL